MTPEQFAAIMVAFAAVLGGVARCIAELRAYHKAVNSKMDALLELTATSSYAEGKLGAADSDVGKSPTENQGNPPPSARWRRGHN